MRCEENRYSGERPHRTFCNIAGDSSLNPSVYTRFRSGERLALATAMSRPLRLHVPGLLHHVFARGNEKACIYADDQDYESFLELLADTLPRFDVRCVAYCLVLEPLPPSTRSERASGLAPVATAELCCTVSASTGDIAASATFCKGDTVAASSRTVLTRALSFGISR